MEYIQSRTFHRRTNKLKVCILAYKIKYYILKIKPYSGGFDLLVVFAYIYTWKHVFALMTLYGLLQCTKDIEQNRSIRCLQTSLNS